MRVLYVDDDRVNSLLFLEACRLAPQVEVETAGTGEEALAVVESFRPDLLVIDLHLPDTTGDRLLPRLRAALQRPTLPAVLCTADAEMQVGSAARDAGFFACWTKPVNLGMLLSELARLSALDPSTRP